MKRATVVLKPDERAAWARLQRARPEIEWHKASLRSADFLGDGSATRVMVGNDDSGTGFVGLVHAGREGPQNPGIVQVGASIELGFEKIESEQAWLVHGSFALVGCRPRRGKWLLRVVDTATQVTSIVYWHSEERRFATWCASAAVAPEAWEDESLTG